jgi:hypothetical protein
LQKAPEILIFSQAISLSSVPFISAWIVIPFCKYEISAPFSVGTGNTLASDWRANQYFTIPTARSRVELFLGPRGESVSN